MYFNGTREQVPPSPSTPGLQIWHCLGELESTAHNLYNAFYFQTNLQSANYYLSQSQVFYLFHWNNRVDDTIYVKKRLFGTGEYPYKSLIDYWFKTNQELPHFQRDWTAKDLKFCSRTSVSSWLLRIWSSASALPLCGDCQRSEVTLPHCLEYQWCEVPLPHLALSWLPMMWHELRSALLLCQFFRRCEVPLLHFRPPLTAKDMVWFDLCFTTLQHISGHFGGGQ